MVKTTAAQLSGFALRLHGVGINGTGDERFFSQTGLTHTKLRNRLSNDKVTAIARLRHDLNLHMNVKRKRTQCVVSHDPVAPTDDTDDSAATAPPLEEDATLDEATPVTAEEFDAALDFFIGDWVMDKNIEGTQEEVELEATAENATPHVRTKLVAKAPLKSVITELVGTLDEKDCDFPLELLNSN
jgi:hypothetical protein